LVATVDSMRVESIPVADSRPLRHAVLRPHEPPEAIAWQEPPEAVAYAAFEDGAERPIAVGLVGRDGEPGSWRVRGMATEPEARGRGAGTAVLAALIDHAREQGAERVWCNARIAARTLYDRAGFIVVSEEFEIEGIGPHYRMELTLD
jgi:GNAT superfamily N-acetyltransferase